MNAGKASKAVERFKDGKSMGLGGEIDALSGDMEKRESEIVAARREEQTQAMAQLITVAVGATALALILALVLGAWIADRISRSIGQAIADMSSSSTEIAAAVSETTSTVEELGASSRQSAPRIFQWGQTPLNSRFQWSLPPLNSAPWRLALRSSPARCDEHRTGGRAQHARRDASQQDTVDEPLRVRVVVVAIGGVAVGIDGGFVMRGHCPTSE